MSLFVEASIARAETPSAEAVLRRHGRSFHLASHVLPKPVRARSARLYAFCRHVDDLADTEQDRNRAARALYQLRQDLVEGSPRSGISADFLALAREIDLPLKPALSLIDTVAEELYGRRIETERELLEYAYGVAGTVGLMMSRILGSDNPDAQAHAVDLGIAMQLTNISRDVGEDAAMNRIYLPRTWLGSMATEDILQPSERGKQQLRQATQRCLALAEHYYRSGLAGLQFLPRRCRYSIAVAAQVYRAIGDRIAAADHCSWEHRAIVPRTTRLRVAAGALFRQISGSSALDSAQAQPPCVSTRRNSTTAARVKREPCPASRTSTY